MFNRLATSVLLSLSLLAAPLRADDTPPAMFLMSGDAQVLHISPSGTDSDACGTESDPCKTLRKGVQRARAGDVLRLSEGRFPTREIELARDLSIIGAGREATIIDAERQSRILRVNAGVRVRVEGLTLTGGYEIVRPDAFFDVGRRYAVGGAIENWGALTLWDVIVADNEARGPDGAAGAPGAPGTQGDKGSSAKPRQCKVGESLLACTRRATGAAGLPGDWGEQGGAGAPGGDAWGGGIYSGGRLLVVNSLFINNRAIGGAGGTGGTGGQGGLGGEGGDSGHIRFAPGITIGCIDVRGAQGGYGGYGGYGGTGGAGGKAWGGGIFFTGEGAEGATIINTEFIGNAATSGTGGAGGQKGQPGERGYGGLTGRPPSDCIRLGTVPQARGPRGPLHKTDHSRDGETGAVGWSSGGAIGTQTDVANVELANVAAYQNSSGAGGAIAFYGPGSARHLTLIGNRAERQAGGILVYNTQRDDVRILNSVIWDNQAGTHTPEDAALRIGDGSQIAAVLSDGSRAPVIRQSCVEGLSGRAALQGGNIDGCVDIGFPRLEWETLSHPPGSLIFVPDLGSPLINAASTDDMGRDRVDLDRDEDRDEALSQDLRGAARAFNYPFWVDGMRPRDAKDRPDMGAYEAFVRVTAWDIGAPLSPPSGADIVLQTGVEPTITPRAAATSFFWDALQNQLIPVAEYPVEPVVIEWKTVGNSAAEPGVPAFSFGRADWPDDAMQVAANAPIDLRSEDGHALRFYARGNPAGDSVDFDPMLAGLADGAPLLVSYLPRAARDLTQASPRFVVLRGTRPRDMAPERATCTVGTPITFAGHNHPSGLSGIVGDPRAPVDMGYDGAAYDAATRTGPIVAVNASAEAPTYPIVVAWYRKGLFGAHWPDIAVQYDCVWPSDAPELTPGATTGLPLPEGPAVQARVWHQPNKDAAGYLQNLSHAVLAKTEDGADLFALRDAAGSHVVVRSGGPDAPRHHVFRVSAASSTIEVQPRVAGTKIPPPAPIAALMAGPCDAVVASGPLHRDHTGQFWAEAATAPDAPATIDWWYPVQPGMARDLDGDTDPDVAIDSCLPWAGQSPTDTGHKVHYPLDWPTDPTQMTELRVGQSFDLAGAAATEMVYGADLSARLLPLSRSLRADLALPPQAAMADRRGWLTGLPGTLPDRLRWDRSRQALILTGGRDAGLFLINRLSRLERDAAIALAPDDQAWITALDTLHAASSSPDHLNQTRLLGEDPLLSTGAITDEGYVALVLNDDANAGTEVSMQILKVACPIVAAPIRMQRPANLFSAHVDFTYGADFGGEQDRMRFEWRRQALERPDQILADTDPDRDGWARFAGSGSLGGSDATDLGQGLNNVALTSGDPGLLENTAVLGRYAGFDGICPSPVSPWSGEDVATPTQSAQPKTAKSWPSTVMARVNAFDPRQSDLVAGAEATDTSLIALAGPRYEGDVQLTAEGGLSAGLIEIYDTLLRRSMGLAFGVGGRTSPAVNGEIALVAGRRAELYLALGDEAATDALDPSIVADTEIGDEAARTSAMFPFQARVASRLDEELALLRGLAGDTGSTRIAPVYNRLRWAVDTGRVSDAVYVLNYGIDRVIDSGEDTPESVLDYARRLFPQGHGDAWGHYLTGMKTFYSLMSQPSFTWSAAANLAEGDDGVVTLSASDEEEIFAQIALEKAVAGSRIVELQFRRAYRDDPVQRLLGHPGNRADQNAHWTLADWSRRAAQGAYFDWLALNAALPLRDCPDAGCAPGDTITRIDRGTVPALLDLPQTANRVQLTLDLSAEGLTPLGIPNTIVPFGLLPSEIEYQSQGHFQQVAASTQTALDTAKAALERMEKSMLDIRRATRSEADRLKDLRQREEDLKKALIDLYGRPYPEDIGGPNALYPAGYDGPDIFNYDVVEFDQQAFFGSEFQMSHAFGIEVPVYSEMADLFMDPAKIITFRNGRPARVETLSQDTGTGFAVNPALLSAYKSALPEQGSDGETLLRFVFSPEMGAVLKSTYSGNRSEGKYGEIQFAKLGFLREYGQLRQQAEEYADLAVTIQDQLERLKAKVAGQQTEAATQRNSLRQIEALQNEMLEFEAFQGGYDIAAQLTSEYGQIIASASATNPTSWAATASPAMAAVHRAGGLTAQVLRSRAQYERERVEINAQLQLLSGGSRFYELLVDASGLVESAQRQRQLLSGLKRQELIVREAEIRYLSFIADGDRLMSALVRLRRETAAETRQARFGQGVNRKLLSEAAAAYEGQFDQAARQVYLAAKAYEYETGGYAYGGQFDRLLGDILRKRALG